MAISVVFPLKVTAQSCGVEYADWVKNVDNEDDIEKNVLIPDTGTSTNVDAIDNPKFGDDYDTPQVTTDTMLNRINTTFEDAANTPDTNYTHWIFSRAFRLPSGDTYDNLKDLNKNGDTTSENLVTLAFIHAGRIDGTSDDWLVPFIKKYRQGCHNRPVNVVLFGAIVRLNGTRHYDDSFSHGSKWHITSSKWGDNNTVVFDVMSQSEKVVSGHSTVNCPFDNNDTNIAEVYVGGGHETSARRVSSRFGEKSLYVGENSDSQSVCYSGVTTGNPVNAGERGIQFEYNVDLKGDSRAKPEEIARSVIAELSVDTKPYVVDKDGYANAAANDCGDTIDGAYRLPVSGLNQTNSGDTLSLCPGTYKTSLTLDTPGVSLAGVSDSTGAIVENNKSSGAVLDVTADSAKFRKLTFKSGDYGLRLKNSNHSSVLKSRFVKNDTAGIGIDNTKNIDFIDNDVKNFGTSGVILDNDTKATIGSNLIKSTRGSGISVKGSSIDFSVKYNQIKNMDTGLNLARDKISDFKIKSNNVMGNTTGIHAKSSDSMVLKQNTISESKETGIKLVNDTEVLLRENTLDTNQGNGLEITGGGVDYDLIDNKFRSNDTGINVKGRVANNIMDIEVMKNNVTGNTTGIYAKNSDSMVLKQNTITTSKRTGIKLVNDTEVLLRDNSLDTNQGNGLEITGGANNYELIGNKFWSNDTGISLSDKIQDEEIHLNQFISNTVGLYVTADETIHAEANWWSDTAGPAGNASDTVTGETTSGAGEIIKFSDTAGDSRLAYKPYLEISPSTAPFTVLDHSDTMNISVDTRSAYLHVNHDSMTSECGGDTVEFYGSGLPSSHARSDSFPENASQKLNNDNFDAMIAGFNLSSSRYLDPGCFQVHLDVSNLNIDSGDSYSIVLYDESEWTSIDNFSKSTVVSSTPPRFIFEPPHLSSFSVLSAASTDSNGNNDTGSTSDSEDGSSDVLPDDDESSCVIESVGIKGNLLNDLRGLRDRILTSVAGRWLVGLYYTAN